MIQYLFGNRTDTGYKMRKQGTWMSKWDDRILEYIYEQGSGAPTEISESDYIPISKQYVSSRLAELAEYKLLESLGNGVYQITEEGWYYLEGGYNAETGDFLHKEAPQEGIHNFKRPFLWAKVKMNQLTANSVDQEYIDNSEEGL